MSNQTKPASTTTKKAPPRNQLPALMDIPFQVANILVIVVTVAVGILSFLQGCTLLDILIRCGVSILSLGFIAYFIVWRMVNGSFKAFEAGINEETPGKDKESGVEIQS